MAIERTRILRNTATLYRSPTLLLQVLPIYHNLHAHLDDRQGYL